MPLDVTKLGKDINDTTPGSQGDDKGTTPQIDPKIIQALKEAGAAEYHAKLATDPDFASLVKARQTGKKVKLVEEGASDPTRTATTPSPQAEPNFETMSEKEKLLFVANSAASIASEGLKKELKLRDDKIDSLLQHSANLRRAEIESNVTAAKTKYKDFESYEAQMAQIATENKNLTVDELYILAKARKGEVIPKSSLTSSERPTNSISRPHPRREIKPGVLGIRSLLNDSIANNLSRIQAQNESEE